jgi:hypothetical protein
VSDPVISRPQPPVERRPAIWPWLLLPLAALTLFYLLETARERPAKAPQQSDAPLSAPADADDAH